MKKFLLAIAILMAGTVLSSCTADLWDRYNDLDSRVKSLEAASAQMNKDIQALKSLVDAVNARLYVTEVVDTEEACTFRFSNGEYVTISKGNDAPVISIKKDVDGCYYWTSDGEFLYTDEGKKLKAEGQDGVSPLVRIHPETKIWEISTDGGQTWMSTGEKATGTDSVFRGIDLQYEDYIELELADGSKLNIPRYNEKIDFGIDGAQRTVQVKYGQTKTFALRVSEISDFFILKSPAGWDVALTDKELKITAPAAGASAEMEGDIVLSALTVSRYSILVRQRVKAVDQEIRVLTFEDEDYTGDVNFMGEKNWSSLISERPSPAWWWGDYLNPYRWSDKNNTELYNNSLVGWQEWVGGVGISNHVKTEKVEDIYFASLCIPYQAPDGNNFAVALKSSSRPYIAFSDQVERTIDHLSVINTTAVAQFYEEGSPIEEFPAATESDFYKLIAIGFDAGGNEVARTEFLLGSGTKAVRTWTEWDLSALGKVARVEFDFTASDNFIYVDEGGNAYCMLPFYFAFDNVAVIFE